MHGKPKKLFECLLSLWPPFWSRCPFSRMLNKKKLHLLLKTVRVITSARSYNHHQIFQLLISNARLCGRAGYLGIYKIPPLCLSSPDLFVKHFSFIILICYPPFVMWDIFHNFRHSQQKFRKLRQIFRNISVKEIILPTFCSDSPDQITFPTISDVLVLS